MAAIQKDATKTGFDSSLLKACNNDFEVFKKWYDPKFKNMKAEEVWKKIGGIVPSKKEKSSD